MNKIEKCSATQKDRVVIHLNDEEKRIYIEELNEYLKNGWKRGVSNKHRNSNSIAHFGKSPSNKGKPLKKETKEKISNSLKGNIPWNKGIKGKQVSWNKGLTKDTDARMKKISNSKMGHAVSKETRDKLSKSHTGKKLDDDKLKIKLTRAYLTRKKNNTFNTSSSEEKLYNELLELNNTKTIYRQYKDEKRYPFYCDFYIVEDDLFIELNAHWTHGGKPFDPNSKECLEQLEQWREKAKTSQFYKNAIETWTVRDVNKRKFAEKNNLNIKVIY